MNCHRFYGLRWFQCFEQLLPKDDIELALVGENSASYLYTHPWKKFRIDKADYKINNLREVLREL